MSFFDPTGDGENPFEGLPPMFGDIGKFFTSTGPFNWDVAKQTAIWAATEGQSEPNVDPMERINLEEYLRVAQLHIEAATGRSASLTGSQLRCVTLTRAEWALHALDAYRPLLEDLAQALTGAMSGSDDIATNATDELDEPPFSGVLGNMSELLNPALVGIQSGMMVGHLAHRFFGQYDLPLPRPRSDDLLFVPHNIDEFAQDWSLPREDLQLWVCLSQLAHHVILGIPHVDQRLTELVKEYISNFSSSSDYLEEHLGAIDPTDPNAIQIVLDDPNAILGAIQTPQQTATFARLEALVSAIEGYVGYVVEQAASDLIASYSQLKEALLRRRVEETDGDRFVERLFGLSLGQSQYDRGDSFIAGVVERAGVDALNKLWESVENLPTPAEVDAPGLWLARLEISN